MTSITALGLTFSYNVTIGIPLYMVIACVIFLSLNSETAESGRRAGGSPVGFRTAALVFAGI
jgi:hypothetical protein